MNLLAAHVRLESASQSGLYFAPNPWP